MSQTTKKVLKVMTLFGGVQAVGIVCSLVKAKLIAIWIGPIGVGLFGIFNSVLDMLSQATQLNFRQSAVRDVAAASGTEVPRVAGAVRWWAKRLGVFGAVVMLVLSPLWSLISFGHCDYWWAFASLSVAMAAMSLSAGEQVLLQGTGLLRTLGKVSIWGVVLATVLIIPLFYFLRVRSIVPAIVATSIASLVAFMLVSPVKSAKLPRRESVAIGKGFLRLGLFMTVASLASTGASYAFLSYLNVTASTGITGLYQAGYTLVVKYVGLIFTALAMEYYPRLAQLNSRPGAAALVVSHQITLLMWVMVSVIVGFVVLDQFIIRLLYSEEFMQCLPLVTIGIGGTVFRAVSYCMAYVIIARGDGVIYVVTEIASAAIGLALNILCYRLWGLMGLGISYVVWYGVYLAMVWSVCHWRYRMRFTFESLGAFLICTVVCASAIVIKMLY
ncbi:MAG: hypothetical protein LIP03_11555 [Bacteroidales bacterium]|nr:hypothetical protein [Bacteroidales bacterium]